MAFTNERLEQMYDGWNNFSQQRKNGIINMLQLEDMEKLYLYGSKSE